ncbi:MAG: EI24 domain-containing protein [Rhodocyclaceae bacterium]|nr:EI24 domain-containing protein [Rhodocyclaceae bacterium]
MKEILRAYALAIRSLGRRDILWHLLWPGLLSLVVWIGLAIGFWNPLTDLALATLNGWDWLHSWTSSSQFGAGFVAVTVQIALGLAILPLIYVTAAILVATVSLPLMLERVARTDYALLEERRGGSQTGSAINALWAALVFGVVLLLSLPLWLVPGLGLVIPLMLTAWLNRRAFRYDALMMHADREEMRTLSQRHDGSMLLLGVGCAALAYIPLVNLFAPAFCGLAFVHYLLAALERHRAESGWVVVGSTPQKRP